MFSYLGVTLPLSIFDRLVLERTFPQTSSLVNPLTHVFLYRPFQIITHDFLLFVKKLTNNKILLKILYHSNIKSKDAEGSNLRLGGWTGFVTYVKVQTSGSWSSDE